MRRVWKVLLVIAVILAVLFGAAYLLVHSYLGKIQYEDGSESVPVTDIAAEEEMTEEETESSTEEDSPYEEIAAVEEDLKKQAEAVTEMIESKDVLNVLLIGCDTRKKNGNGRSDAMILVSVNQKTEDITMTSIMRDCYVTIPGHGNNRINAAYAFGGGNLLMDTIETNFRVPVEKYIVVDFYSFVDIVDAVGGVDINISSEEIKVMNSYIKGLNKLNGRAEDTWLLSDGGMQHLNGTQALAYSRVRYVGHGDFDRTQRQRTVMTKIFEKARDMSLREMHDLLNILLPKVKTNMDEGELLALLLKAPAYLQYDLNQFRIPIDDSYQSMRIRGMAVLGLDFEKNIEALKKEVME